MTTRPASQPLADLVAARREQLGLSLREASAASGGLVSHGRLNEIERGRSSVDGISDKVIEGIAAGLDLPVARVRRAAGLAPRERPFTLPDRANRLNARERQLVLSLIDTLLAAHGEKR